VCRFRQTLLEFTQVIKINTEEEEKEGEEKNNALIICFTDSISSQIMN
jgi:hypothetical protein